MFGGTTGRPRRKRRKVYNKEATRARGLMRMSSTRVGGSHSEVRLRVDRNAMVMTIENVVGKEEGGEGRRLPIGKLRARTEDAVFFLGCGLSAGWKEGTGTCRKV